MSRHAAAVSTRTRTFPARIRRAGLEDVWVPVIARGPRPPAVLRNLGSYDGRPVWEVFILDDDSQWPRTATYVLIDRMDDDGQPVGAWEP